MSGSSEGHEIEEKTNAPIPRIGAYRETSEKAAAQWREAKGEQPFIHCGGCDHFIPMRFLFRCLYCGIWFCKTCAEDHFGQTRDDYLAEVIKTL